MTVMMVMMMMMLMMLVVTVRCLVVLRDVQRPVFQTTVSSIVTAA